MQLSDNLVGRMAHESDPIRAVSELVWNALDAEAWSVSVELVRDEGFLNSIVGVRITDDGHGINPDQLDSQFLRIGDSWKSHATKSLNDVRGLHGSLGEGRLRAFALGDTISWRTVADRADGSRAHTVITANRSNRLNLSIDTTEGAGSETGTVFEAHGGQQGSLKALATESALPMLRSVFAPILMTDERISIHYDGVALDPREQILADDSWKLVLDEEIGEIEIRLIEWKPVPKSPAKKRKAIYFGPDLEHFVYEEDASSLSSLGSFSVYVAWPEIGSHVQSMPLGELAEPPASIVWAGVRKSVVEHFSRQRLRRRREQVAEWKEKGLYPYEGEPPTEVEAAERAVFDVVSGAIGDQVAKKPASAKLTLALLREAIKSDPERLATVLYEVASLDRADLDTLTRLLGETTLPAIIRSTNIVANRRKFLTGLDHLVFDPTDSPTVGERDHLHKILEGELWIFGEQYNLMNSERGLTQMLRSHLKLHGLPVGKLEPVKRWDGTAGRVDLHLAAKSQEHDRVRNLIVELKAPRIVIGRDEMDQVEDYANTIVETPRFHGVGALWDIILVGTDVAPMAQRRIQKEHAATGRIYHVDATDEGIPEVNIYVRRWRDVIDENQRRLAYLTNTMQFDPGVEESLEYFREEYADVLPESIRSQAALEDQDTA